MKSDFGDLRFYDATGNMLSYFVESQTVSSTAHVFVRADLALGNNVIYMTYGNVALTTLSNGKAAMEIFDDMNVAPSGTLTSTVDYVASLDETYYDATNKYMVLTTARNHVETSLEYSFSFKDGFIADFEFWAGGGTSHGADGVYLYAYNNQTPTFEDVPAGGFNFNYDEHDTYTNGGYTASGPGRVQIMHNGSNLTDAEEQDIDNSTWRAARALKNGNELELYLDGTLKISHTTALTGPGNKFGLGSRTGALNNEHRVRNFMVRKYVGTAVIVTSYGAQETNKDLCGFTNNTINSGIIVAEATGKINVQNNIIVDDFTANLSGSVGNIVKACQSNDWVYYGDNTNRNFSFGVHWNEDLATNGLNYNKAPIRNATVNIVDDGMDSVEDYVSFAIPFATYGMSRYWNVNNVGTLDGAVDVRFFYATADKTDVESAAQDFVVANSAAGIVYEQFKWFKIVAANYNPALHLTAKEVIGEIELTDVGGPTIDGVVSAQFDAIASFSGGTGAAGVGNNSGTSLPVELIFFTAKSVNNEAIQLDWITATEINNEGFEVQRSTDGANFEKIGWLAGNGNTNKNIDYALLDKDVEYGVIYYYRLKQLDFDGVFEYSKIVAASLVNFDKVEVSYFIPNPGSNFSSLIIEGMQNTQVQIEIMDNIGRKVVSEMQVLESGKNTFTFDLNEFSNGVYTAKIIMEKDEFTRKLVVRK